MNGSTSSSGLEAPRHRVDGEVSPRHVVLDRERRVGDDLEVVAARSRAALGTRRRELDPGGCEPTQLPVARVEPHPDLPAGDLELLDAAVWLEQAPQALDVDPGHDKVGVLRVEPKQLVAHSAPDEVGIDAKAAHEVFDSPVHDPEANGHKG